MTPTQLQRLADSLLIYAEDKLGAMLATMDFDGIPRPLEVEEQRELVREWAEKRAREEG